jgi:Ca2+-binding EF-hand superfamily protein
MVGTRWLGAVAAALIVASTALGGDAGGTVARGGRHQRLRRLFNQLDKDHDGKISRDEAVRSSWMTNHFDEIDANKDSFITFDELVKFVAQHRHDKNAVPRLGFETEGGAATGLGIARPSR